MSTRRFTGYAAVLLPLAILAGCAAGPEPRSDFSAKLEQRDLQQGDAVDRIQGFRIDDWSPLDDRHLMVRAGPSRHYLVTLAAPCHDMRFAQRVGFTNTVGSLTRFDSVVIADRNAPEVRCPISELHRLEPLDDDES